MAKLRVAGPVTVTDRRSRRITTEMAMAAVVSPPGNRM